jgi:hypothetical protein
VAEVAGYYTMEKELVTLLEQLINQDPEPEVREIARVTLSRYNNKIKLFT